MGKRSFDHIEPAVMSTDKVPKKNERSHEENQERAYIAASRRSDRSIEARLQSARMASEIHKKRTGKGFKITEEIVRKEEMYEEEDDELPRHYRALTAHLHTSSPTMNHRANAFVTSQIAAATLAREIEINRQFAEQFPNVPSVSGHLTQAMYAQPVHPDPNSLHPYQQGFHFGSPPPVGYHPRHRSQSLAQIAPRPQPQPQPQPQASYAQYHHQNPMARHASFDDPVPALTPGSGRTHTPSSAGTPPLFQTDELQFRGQSTSALPVDPSLGLSTTFGSSFTSELANNAKDMVNIDPTDPTTQYLLGLTDGGELAGSDATSMVWSTDFSPRDIPIPSSEQQHFEPLAPEPSDALDITQAIREESFPLQEGSRVSTPGCSVNSDSWKEWLADDEAEFGIS
ncbi:hypothetical protein OQA88_8480 [Cercophora sp. LCS_1]